MSSKLSVQRCFHPVGQGAFYSEKFTVGEESRYVIYDCGTKTKTVNIENVIQKYFTKKGAKIPFLFISHLDSDHISGIQHILEYCDVDYLFLPLLTDEIKLVLLADTISEDAFFLELICNTDETVRSHGRGTQVVYVESSSENADIPGRQALPFDLLSSEDNFRHDYIRINTEGKIVIPSGMTFTFPSNEFSSARNKMGASIWCFSPFNYEFPKRSEEFKKRLDRLNILYNSKDIKEVWTRHKDEIKNEFDETGGGKNNQHTNNMSLYSGPCVIRDINEEHTARFFMLGEYSSCRCCDCCGCGKCWQCYVRHNAKIGAVYTGDYKAKPKKMMKQFDLHFDRWEDTIGILQLPHHGSPENFNNKFIDYSDIFFVSFGLSNQYHHPSPTVIHELLRCGKVVYFSHEGSGVIQNIEILE